MGWPGWEPKDRTGYKQRVLSRAFGGTARPTYAPPRPQGERTPIMGDRLPKDEVLPNGKHLGWNVTR